MKHKVKMRLLQGHVEIEGASSAWISFCIGAAVLLLSATPLAWVVLK